MGEVYTNSAGLEKASNDFKEVEEKITEEKKTLYTALNDFTKDMLGNAFLPMCKCALQIYDELQDATGRFSETSKLMTKVRFNRSVIDNMLKMNAMGNLSGPIGS